MAEVTLEFQFGTYRGEVNEQGLRHGRGTLVYKSGNTYEGEWVEGAASGHGIKRFKNGDVYEGSWLGGARHGHGVYTFRNGAKYIGEYLNDRQHGKGRWETPNETYEGEYANGMRHGHGVEVVSREGQDPVVYEGGWVDGKRHGVGVVKNPDGSYWKGEWCKGVRGEGKLYNADGSLYEPPEEGTSKSAPQEDKVAQAQPQQPLPAAHSADPQEQLKAAMAGIANFGNNFTDNLDRAMGGLDALEAQLEALSNMLGIEDDALGDDEGDVDAALPSLEGFDLGAMDCGLDPPAGCESKVEEVGNDDTDELAKQLEELNQNMQTTLQSAEAHLKQIATSSHPPKQK